MGAKTSIEWTAGADGSPGSTWNPIRARHRQTGKLGWHCEHVSEGCRNCYAETLNRRLGTGLDFKPGHRKDVEIVLDEEMLAQPLRWRKGRTIFVGSMTDLFADFVEDAWLDRIFAVMALTPQHRYMLLTKRPGGMRVYVAEVTYESHLATVKRFALAVPRNLPSRWDAFDWPLPNVWLGTSCEDKATAAMRIPHLLETPAVCRFVSLEPLLGPVDLTRLQIGPDLWLDARTGAHEGLATNGPMSPIKPSLDLVIIGGESGLNARDYDLAWPRAIIAQCHSAGVAVFHKQLGARPVQGHTGYPIRDRKGGDMSEWPEDLRVREMPGMNQEIIA